MKNNQTILLFAAFILAGSLVGCSMFGGSNSNGISMKGLTATKACQMLGQQDFETKDLYDGKTCSGSNSFGGGQYLYFVAGENDKIQYISFTVSDTRPEMTTFFLAQANLVAKMSNGELPKNIETSIKFTGANIPKIYQKIGDVDVEFSRSNNVSFLRFTFSYPNG